MPRRRLIETADFPYHVTARSNNKEWFYLPMEACWKIFCGQLYDTTSRYQVQLYAFTLMSNHFHMILQTPLSNIGEVMRHFMTGVAKAIQLEANRINHIFGSRYKWSLLQTPSSVAYVYKYVLRNPVRGGLCKLVEDYPYSSLRLSPPASPVSDGIGELWKRVPRQYEERLSWLNLPVPKEAESLIGAGLRRKSFCFSKDNTRQKFLRQLEQLYGVASHEL